MTWRAETASLIPGRWVAGDRGLGVQGYQIPSTGDAGASFLYNDLELPGDALKEIRGLILSPPSAGTFTAYEDGSFSLLDAPDGVYTFTYRLFVDGVDMGTSTATITIGAAPPPEATLTIALDPAAFSGTAVGADASAAEVAATLDGLSFSGGATIELAVGTASIRELILRQVAGALSGTSGVGTRIFRSRDDALALDESPSLVILPEREDPTEDIVGMTEKALRVTIAIYQRGSEPDALADPIALEVHTRLMLDPTLGGLAIDTAEDGTQWDFDSADGTACWLDMRFKVWYRHSRADLAR